MHIKNKHELAPKQSCPMKGCEKTFSTIGNMKVSFFVTWCSLSQKEKKKKKKEKTILTRTGR